MRHFKIVPFLHEDVDEKIYFYAVKRLRWFLIFPYWSFRVFNNTDEHCYAEYIGDAEEVVKTLKVNRVSLIDKIKRRWR